MTVIGALLIFNGFFMALLGFMTTFGMTSETLIKWHEIGVTAEQSDRLGLIIFGIGIVTVIAGRLLARRAPELIVRIQAAHAHSGADPGHQNSH